MFTTIRKTMKNHLTRNAFRYFFLLLCFVVGITAGAIFAVSLPEEKSTELMNTVNGYCTAASGGGLTYLHALKTSFLQSIRLLAILVFASFSLYLTPLIFVNISAKGFVMGFTVGFMSMYLGMKGFLLALVSVLPQIMLEFPIILLLSILCFNRAVQRKYRPVRSRERTTTYDNQRFTYSVVIIYLVLLAAILLDTFVITEFTKLVSGFIVT